MGRRKPRKEVFRGPESNAVLGEVLALDPRAWGVEYHVADDREPLDGDDLAEAGDAVAIVDVRGPLEQRGDSCWQGYDDIREAFACALDSDASAVLLRIDSPGGECAGLFECVRDMRTMAEASGKRVVAYVDEAAYSAAYALATVAEEIVLPESGGVGSIGVIATLCDRVGLNEQMGINVAVIAAGARKADGHPDVPISDGALEATAHNVERLATMFYEAVAEARPLSVDELAGLEAGVFHGDEALEAGLADRIMGLSELLSELSGGAMGADLDDDGEDALENEETSKMDPKQKAQVAAAVDILSKPLIQHAPTLEAKADAYKRTETSEVMEESESEDAEEGTRTKTKTTTTTESETTEAPDAEEDAEDDDAEDAEDAEEAEGEDAGEIADEQDDTDDDDKEGNHPPSKKDAPSKSKRMASAATRFAGSSTRDVLACVRELTGAGHPGAQIGALRALVARAAKVPALEARLAKQTAAARKSKVVASVDKAIRASLLTPGQRAWAISAGMKDPAILEGYLANARPVAPPKPLRQPEVLTKAAAKSAQGLTPAEESIAKKMAIDPERLAAFKAKGVIPTITH